MQQPSAQSQPLGDVDFDPSIFTSFGAPPPNSAAGTAESNGKRFTAFFGAVASAFRRVDDVSQKTVASSTEVTTPATASPAPSEKVAVKTQPTDQRDNTGSFSSNSDLSTAAQVSIASSSPSAKRFASLFRKNPPISIGLNAKWASDDACHHCYACSLKFTTFLRRHHCRFCGRIFCDSCSSFRIPGQPFGAREGLRSCEVCYRETLRSLLETHHQSLSDDMLQKIAALYAVVATSTLNQNQSQVTTPHASTPVVQGSASIAGGRSRVVQSPRVTSDLQSATPALTNIVPPSPDVPVSIVDDSSSVILDPLRQLATRRMTMDEMNNDNSGASGDEDYPNQQGSDALPQFSNLKEIFESAFQPNSGLKFETRRSLAKTFYHCFSGEILLKWLMVRDHELNSFQAAAIAKSMLDFGIITPLQQSNSNNEVFALSTYYRPGRAAGFMPIADQNSTTEKPAAQVPQTSRASVSKGNATVSQNAAAARRNTGATATTRTSSFGVALTANSTKTNQMNVQLDAAVGESLQKNFLIKERPNEVLPYRAADVEAFLRRLYKIHIARLCSHLLAVDELDADKWQRNILQIVYQVVRIIKPRPRDYSDALDIRRCVKIKKIYDSSLSAHFEYVDGLVFTKSLSHRLMKASHYNPRFLLLQTGLDFERDCQQLTTLDVVVHQEAEQMQRYVSQIASTRPTVVFCGGSIPHLACKQMVANDITAASWVKPHILEQIARYTGAAVLPSVDSLSLSGAGQSVRLGSCRTFASFSVHMHSRLQKTFLCLSGCDPIGCTLLIRDSSYSDLIKVKRILKLLILAAYDGLVLAQYLIAVRADPGSLDLSQPYKTNDKFSSRVSSAFDDEESIGSGRSGSSRRSLSATRSSPAFRAARAAKDAVRNWRTGDSELSLAALDLSSLSTKQNSTLALAFSLANSDLLSLSPVVRLPDPLKKSALFEASKSRIYFESPLFSLFASSYVQGKRPLEIANPSPPMWMSKSFQKAYDPFFTTPITGEYRSEQVQTLLARFRRQGFLFDILDDVQGQPVSKKTSVDSKRPSAVSNDKCGAWVKPLSIFESQCLHVLTSTFSLDSQLSPFRHCDGPRLVSCPFHARSDLSLGAFLENQCFVPTTICPRRGCGAPLVDHVRRFASNYGRIEIVVRPLAEPILVILSMANPQGSNPVDESPYQSSSPLITWSMCSICRTVTPFAEVSDDVWGMSLASYLHLKLYGIEFCCAPVTSDSTGCSHSFGQHYLQYFAKESLVAVVRYCPINVYDLVIPLPRISLELKHMDEYKDRHAALLRDHETLTSAILNHFDTVQAYLENCRTHLLYSPSGLINVSQPVIDLMSTSESYLADERKLFITNMAALELAITDPSWENPNSTTIVRTTEQIVFELFQNVSQSWLDWNDRLRNLIRFLRTSSTSSVLSNNTEQLEPPMHQTPSLSTSLAASSSPVPLSTTPMAINHPISLLSETGSSSKDVAVSIVVDPPPPSTKEEQVIPRQSSLSTLPQPVGTTASSSRPLGKAVFDFITDSEMFKQPLFKTKLKLPLKTPFDPSFHYVFRNQTYLFPIPVYDNEPSSLIAFAMSTDEYNQRLEMLISVAGKEPERKFQPLTVNRTSKLISSPVSFSRNRSCPSDMDIVDSAPMSAEKAAMESTALAVSTGANVDDFDDDHEIATDALVNEMAESEDKTETSTNQADDGLGNDDEDEEDDPGSAIEFGSTLDPVDTFKFSGVRPMIASRRPVLDSARFVAPRSNPNSRPSSAQSSPNVTRKNKQLHPSGSIPNAMSAVASNSVNINININNNNNNITNTPSPRHLTPQPATGGKTDSPDARTKDVQELDPHIRISWTDAGVSKESTTKFTVTIYHAAVFAEIRKLLVDKTEQEESDVRGWLETSFLRTLSRCTQWQTAGGRSGLRFYKTYDGRLILKQVSKDELKTIFKLAPDYASIVNAAREQNRPSALVPILGAYQVSFDNGATGRSSKMDVIVMTNLFRGYSISAKFDLKGSERNRFVKHDQTLSPNEQQPTQERQPYEMVLMDENLLIRSLQDPLYVHPHSKQLLLQAISADTQFLTRNSVMDYSLLVGIDSEARCIVVGIIDYLRTFTFDKKLEYVVKSTGLLGGQGKAPTILYPNKYRDRFLSAMRHFFLEVPDHWLAYETHNLRLPSQN